MLLSLVREAVAAMLLVVVFSSGYLYNVGIGGGADSSTVCLPATYKICADTCTIDVSCLNKCLFDAQIACENTFPGWALAVVVGLCVWLIFLLGSYVFKCPVEGNPIVSSVILGFQLKKDGGLKSRNIPKNLGKYLAKIAAMIVGSGVGVVFVWLFAGRTINQIQNVFYNDAGDPVPSGAQLARAIVGEAFAVLVLILASAVAYHLLSGDPQQKQKGKLAVGIYSRIIGLYYFLYMIVIWTHTRFTADIIRGSWLCIMSLPGHDSDECSMKGGAPIVVWYMVIHVALSFLAIGVGWYAEKMRAGDKESKS
jgi:hypothetical protein